MEPSSLDAHVYCLSASALQCQRPCTFGSSGDRQQWVFSPFPSWLVRANYRPVLWCHHLLSAQEPLAEAGQTFRRRLLLVLALGCHPPLQQRPRTAKRKKKKGEWKGSHAKDKWTEEGIQTIEFPCCNLFWNKTVVVVTQGYAWGRIAQSYARTHIYRCQKTDDIWIRSVVW